jgi:hypothetical protein
LNLRISTGSVLPAIFFLSGHMSLAVQRVFCPEIRGYWREFFYGMQINFEDQQAIYETIQKGLSYRMRPL